MRRVHLLKVSGAVVVVHKSRRNADAEARAIRSIGEDAKVECWQVQRDRRGELAMAITCLAALALIAVLAWGL